MTVKLSHVLSPGKKKPLPIVQLTVNGLTIDALVDTGAYQSIINEKAADEIGIREFLYGPAYTIGGNEFDGAYFIAETVTVDGINRRNVPVNAAPFADHWDFQGIIGMDILQEGDLFLSMRKKKMTLTLTP